jgi:hypothetical protein
MSTKTATAKTAPDYEWLIAQRNDVQRLLLDLYRFVAEHEADLVNNRAARSTFLLIVGSAYSLWQAVFLAKRHRSTAEIVRHAAVFLEAVVRDNTVANSADRELLEWSAGYYLNNARYRLVRLREKLAQLRPDDVKSSAAFKAFEQLEDTGIDAVTNDITKSWRVAFDCANRGFELLKAEMKVED